MTDSTPIDERDFGTLERDGTLCILRYTRRLHHAPDRVFRALTDDDELAAWFPTTIEGDRAAGAALTFSHRDGEAEAMHGELLAYEPPSLMELRWGTDIVRFEIAPDGEGCVLTLTATLDELGRTARDGAGWHGCLDALVAALGGQKLDAVQRWRDVVGRYVTRLGPEAATIGPPQGWQDVHGAASLPT